MKVYKPLSEIYKINNYKTLSYDEIIRNIENNENYRPHVYNLTKSNIVPCTKNNYKSNCALVCASTKDINSVTRLDQIYKNVYLIEESKKFIPKHLGYTVLGSIALYYILDEFC